jgi:alkylhydroperoxidase family enzyme
MARLPYLNASDLAPEHQHLLKRNINLLRLMSHSPKGATAFHTMGQYIRFDSPLNPRLREMAILQIGYVTRSVYEYTHHIKISRDFGVSDDDIRAIADETSGKETALDDLTRSVLRAAREMTQNLAASASTFASLKAQLDNESLTDLVLIISFYNAVVRFLATMDIDNEPEYQVLLAEFPFSQEG